MSSQISTRLLMRHNTLKRHMLLLISLHRHLLDAWNLHRSTHLSIRVLIKDSNSRRINAARTRLARHRWKTCLQLSDRSIMHKHWLYWTLTVIISRHRILVTAQRRPHWIKAGNLDSQSSSLRNVSLTLLYHYLVLSLRTARQYSRTPRAHQTSLDRPPQSPNKNDRYH